MSTIYVSKTQALALINLETGYGRRVVEKWMEKLVETGRIKILDDPDGRAMRISRTDVDFIIRFLKGEVEAE